MRLHAVAIGAHDVERIARHREAEGDRQALRRVGRAGEQPHPLRIARHVLEQDRRRLGLGVVDDLGERPHFEIPIGALDPQQFAGRLGSFDELAQIRMRAIIGVIDLRLCGIEHGLLSNSGARLHQLAGKVADESVRAISFPL